MERPKPGSVADLKLQKRILEQKLGQVEVKFQRHRRQVHKRRRQRRELDAAQRQRQRQQERVQRRQQEYPGPSTIDAKRAAAWPGAKQHALPTANMGSRPYMHLESRVPTKLVPMGLPTAVAPTETALTLLKRNSELRTRQHLRCKHARQRPQLPPLADPAKPVGKTGAFRPRKGKQIPPSLFPVAYSRGELPCKVKHQAAGNVVEWTTPLEELNMDKYLPIFFDGMRELEFPYQFMAKRGVEEIVTYLRPKPEVLVRCVPRLVAPIRTNLFTRVPSVVCTTLGCVQAILRAKGVGKALVPFYPQLLSMCNLFKSWRQNLGDGIDYKQVRNEDLGDLVRETLEMMERTGGKGAGMKIKAMVPTYESCLKKDKARPPPPGADKLPPTTPYEERNPGLVMR